MLPYIRFSFVEGAPIHKSTKTVDKQASGPHTYTLGREIKSPVQMVDFELMKLACYKESLPSSHVQTVSKQSVLVVFNYDPTRKYREYRKGTSIRQAPVFWHLRAFRKSSWKFIIWMNGL